MFVIISGCYTLHFLLLENPANGTYDNRYNGIIFASIHIDVL